MLIDCDSCTVRGAACAGCAVTALLDTPDEIVNLGAAELYAIEVLARAGLEVTVLADSKPVDSKPSAARRSGPVRLELSGRHGRRRAGWEGAA
jgi:hypothetical protein